MHFDYSAVCNTILQNHGCKRLSCFLGLTVTLHDQKRHALVLQTECVVIVLALWLRLLDSHVYS